MRVLPFLKEIHVRRSRPRGEEVAPEEEARERMAEVKRRLLLALLPLSLGGCIVIPTPGVFSVRHVRNSVGKKDSSAPLKIGISNRTDVLRVIGKPDRPGDSMTTSDWAYSNDALTGYWIWLWPFVHGGPIQPIYDTSGVHISFGPDGRISGYNDWDW